MSKHTHIGYNNVIARAFKALPNTNCMSFHQTQNIEKFDCDMVSISAFDPQNKTQLKSRPIAFSNMIKKIPRNCRVIYFSTARIFDEKPMPKHKPYIENKLVEEQKLFALCNPVNIIYLPLIIPEERADNSPFFSLVSQNFKKGHINFDVSESSTYNFIRARDVPLVLKDPSKLKKRQSLISKSPTSIRQIIVELLEKNPDLLIKTGAVTTTYPEKISCARIFSKNDMGKKGGWIIRAMETQS